MKFSKTEAQRIVLNCAVQYEKNLLNKRFLVIYREREDHSIHYIEIGFYEGNYQHLTGLELVDTTGKVLRHQSNDFYRKCRDKKLDLNDFCFKKDGTTPLKLAALPVLTKFTKITKIAGDYNNSRPYLVVDKIVGGVNFCLGLSQDDGIYFPSSALLEDIKSLTTSPSQVLAIIAKENDADKYSVVKHVAKGLNLSKLVLPDEISEMINLGGTL